MRPSLMLLALLAASGAPLAAENPPETCEQIRAHIGAQPGDPHLLRLLAARSKECGFSSAEFYKAAYGDRPPAREPESHRDRPTHHDDDEDDD